MRRIFVAGCLALMASAAHAQDSTVVEACKRLAAHLYTSDEIDVTVVQDFSALTPPRARMQLATLLGTTLTCTFTSPERPLRLTQYCHTEFLEKVCEEDGDERFEEIRYLLEQDGY